MAQANNFINYGLNIMFNLFLILKGFLLCDETMQ